MRQVQMDGQDEVLPLLERFLDLADCKLRLSEIERRLCRGRPLSAQPMLAPGPAAGDESRHANTTPRPSASMRAAILTADRGIEITDVPTPAPGGDEVLLRVEAAGVCGTDLHFVDGLLDPGGPRILGHEIAGAVKGEDASGTVERHAVYNVLHCGVCRYCRSGRERLCSNSPGMLGFGVDGGFAEQVVVPRRNLVPLPPSVSPETAAVMACSGMSAVHAVRLSGVGLGDVVMVDGIGGVGVMVIQVAATAGAQVIAVGDSEAKLEMARNAGAAETILVQDDHGYDLLPDVITASDSRPVAFFETVGTAPSMQAGYLALAPGGSFVQIGYTAARIDLHPSMLIRNELRLVTSAAGSLDDLRTAIGLAARGALEAVTTPRQGLEELSDALERIRARTVLGRSVITFD